MGKTSVLSYSKCEIWTSSSLKHRTISIFTEILYSFSFFITWIFFYINNVCVSILHLPFHGTDNHLPWAQCVHVMRHYYYVFEMIFAKCFKTLTQFVETSFYRKWQNAERKNIYSVDSSVVRLLSMRVKGEKEEKIELLEKKIKWMSKKWEFSEVLKLFHWHLTIQNKTKRHIDENPILVHVL